MALTTFTSGQVLTAAQMNAVQANDYNQTVSTKTASYTLVAADKGTRVVMNNASATTITVNTSLFSAGDTLVLQNIGAGTCTVTAGTATVATAGSLAIPQNGSGILYFTSAGVSIYYPSAAAATTPGLVLISSTTISAAATTNVNDVFSATYDNYKIILNGTASTGVSALTTFRLRVGGADATTNYTQQRIYSYSSTVLADRDTTGTDDFFFFDTNATAKFGADLTLLNPFNAAATKYIQTALNDNNSIGIYNTYTTAVNTNSTSYTGFSLISAGTISGVLKVYGMAN